MKNPFENNVEEEQFTLELEDAKSIKYRKRLNAARNFVPNVLWDQIFSESDLQSILRFSKTNKFFSTLIKENDKLWNALIKKYLTKNPKLMQGETGYQCFLRYIFYICKDFKNGFRRDFLCNTVKHGLEVIFLSHFDRLLKKQKNSGVIFFDESLSNALLCFAAEANNLIILKRIMEAGISPMRRYETVFNGATRVSYNIGPLHAAAKEGAFECLSFLHESIKKDSRFNIDDTDRKGRSALHLAAKNGYLKCLKFLVENGADINLQPHKSINERENTALHLAAENGHKECIEFFINNGAELSIEDREGRNAYQLATYYKYYDCAEILKIVMQQKNIPIKSYNMLDEMYYFMCGKKF